MRLFSKAQACFAHTFVCISGTAIKLCRNFMWYRSTGRLTLETLGEIPSEVKIKDWYISWILPEIVTFPSYRLAAFLVCVSAMKQIYHIGPKFKIQSRIFPCTDCFSRCYYLQLHPRMQSSRENILIGLLVGMSLLSGHSVLTCFRVIMSCQIVRVKLNRSRCHYREVNRETCMFVAWVWGQDLFTVSTVLCHCS